MRNIYLKYFKNEIKYPSTTFKIIQDNTNLDIQSGIYEQILVWDPMI